LAGKIQVGLFNIMQEGDVQIKGYPVRLPLDVLLVFTANPEDYTARGKIVTPLKDRMGSEIRTHYPATVEEGMAITTQEAWTERGTSRQLVVPDYLREVVEQVAFLAREDKRVDHRSGVSQRLPIACLEAVVSSAEQRAARNREGRTAARISDLYAAAPAITGKLELEYEGELKGADAVVREIIRGAVGKVYLRRLSQANLQPVIQWFEMGGELKLPESASAAEELSALRGIQGLLDHVKALGANPSDAPLAAAAGEFILEGLWAQKRISRNEERGYYAERAKPAEQREPPGRPPRRPYN
jgi:magnesium chelatase subunit I